MLPRPVSSSVLSIAGAVAAFGLLGLADGLHATLGRVTGLDLVVGVVWVIALYALLGAVAGVLLAGAAALVAPVREWWRRAPPADAFAWPLAAGVVSFAAFVAVYHLSRHFFTAYRNLTLAAFGLTIAVIVVVGLAVLLAVLLRGLVRTWFRTPSGDRRWGLVAFALAWLVPATYGIAHGTTGGQGGALGFLGLLKKDELDARPLVVVALALVVTVVIARRVSRAPRASISIAGVLLGAAVATVFTYGARPAAADAIERRAPLARGLLVGGRALLDRDGDGYAALLGGGDCDDHRRGVSPSADEVAGNGVDEDCSGADLPSRPRHRPSAARSPAAAGARAQGTQARLPSDLSIVLVTVDTLRWDLGYMGNPRPLSPNLDRLAARGVAYERAYSLSSYTGKALAPLFIGRYPSETHRDQQHFTRYGDANTFLAEGLHAAGMHTGAVLPHWYFRKSSGLAQGFDRWDLDAIPRGPGHIDVQESSPAVTARALAMLGDSSFTSGRFFLWVHYLDPHREYLPHDDAPPFGPTRRDAYDGEVRFTDGWVGKLLDAVAALPSAGRIAVILTSDHGEAFGEHDAFFHGRDLWDEMIRVPLIVSIPGVSPRRVSRRVSHVDLAPTLYELAGVPAPPGLSGFSLLPEITGGSLPERPVYAELPIGPYNDERRALVQDGWKLLTIAAGNRFLLFDLEHDPGETHDLAAERPAELARMKEAMAELRAGLDRVDPEGPLTPGGGGSE